MIETTVPRELVERPVTARRTPLRRANTDPLDAVSRIADALTRAPTDATKPGAATRAPRMETVRPIIHLFSCSVAASPTCCQQHRNMWR